MSLLLTLGLGGTGTPPTPPSGGDTPYMNLLLPTVSVTLGPLYATEVNGAFLRVDAHDHTSGYGKPVPTGGLNINADLPFNDFSAVNMKSAGFAIQSPTVGPVGSVYFSGQDFYVLDGTGTPIQITAAGAVNVTGLGSWTGLTSPAQAGYSSVSKKFSLLSNTSGPKYGLLAAGDLLLYPAGPVDLGHLHPHRSRGRRHVHPDAARQRPQRHRQPRHHAAEERWHRPARPVAAVAGACLHARGGHRGPGR